MVKVRCVPAKTDRANLYLHCQTPLVASRPRRDRDYSVTVARRVTVKKNNVSSRRWTIYSARLHVRIAQLIYAYFSNLEFNLCRNSAIVSVSDGGPLAQHTARQEVCAERCNHMFPNSYSITTWNNANVRLMFLASLAFDSYIA
jgi:hypothetical protein